MFIFQLKDDCLYSWTTTNTEGGVLCSDVSRENPPGCACVSGKYDDGSNAACVACGGLCSTCINGTSCETCIDGYYHNGGSVGTGSCIGIIFIKNILKLSDK